MRQSLRETYQSFYSSRDSKSVSPTTGRLHKQRESFGPTVCLISKNPESEPSPAHSDKMHILMLILEIERLNRVVGILGNEIKSQGQRKDRQFEGEGEVQFLRKHAVSMKAAVEQLERDKYQESERQNKVIYTQNNKISEYETQISLTGRRLRQFQQENQNLKQKLKGNQVQLQRAKAEISRMNLSMMMSSQTELHKSMAKEKSSAQAQLWKEKLAKYQNLINEQKNYIVDQKRVIDRLNNSELQLKQRYEYELSMLRKSNQELRDKQIKLQREAASRILNSSAQASREATLKSRQVQKLRDRIEEMTKENEGLKREIDSLSRTKDSSIEQMRSVISELKESLQGLSSDFSQQAQLQQRLKAQNDMIRRENNSLKSQIMKQSHDYTLQIRSLKDEIDSKQQQVTRIRKKRNTQTQSRLRKSLSEAPLQTPRSPKSPNISLTDIIMDVEELRNSNTRIGRLIETKARTQVTHQRVQSYSNYGL